jgi:hypothetical protein
VNLTPTTELEAVNALLRTISEAPVNTLQGALPVDASKAVQLLHSKSREIQTESWAFNTDIDLPLAVTTTGTIPVPNNTLSVDAVDPSLRLVIRAGKLYDRAKRTSTFTAPVRVNITYFLPFDELPEYVRQYITVSAGRQFQDGTLADDAIHRFTAQDEMTARARFMAAEVEQGDYNVLRDSYSSNRVVRRQRVPLY